MSISRFFGSSAVPSARELMYPASRLFRLFDDPFFDQQFPTPLSSSMANTVFTRTPTFDVKETEKEYILQGELPGVDKNNLNLEFTDPQTLSVKGTIERMQEYGAPPTSDQISEVGGAASESGSTDVTKSDTTAKAVAQQAYQPTYWASERVYGEFSRAFKFPAHVDPDGVSASLRNGILNINVPKVGKTASKRIEVAEE
ncbi:HSP20-like chaperone [Lipomyces tetrasporus]|uniref:HSP20-like chaperone n=1 Tax=Lipomyces tetrasporus TaxID=54092 RepID=A0AAD7QU11_9ASCO|nr:HSP20-like chaperone [Lipomyces tetrasporus]KAJ8101370.1 HSP20-like chaperone [Lipomyces tetrasporus]